MNEHDQQNQIRAELSHWGTFFRANIGNGWTGNIIKKTTDGGVYIPDARPLNTGLPVGFPDIFGAVPVTITPDMVGQTVAIFAGIEIKTPTGRVRPEQQHFIEFMAKQGCRVGVARSAEQAVNIARGIVF